MAKTKMKVRFCREETWFVDIEVQASTREEAEELAEEIREKESCNLEWAACDGNEYEPYISNVLDQNGCEIDDDPTPWCSWCNAMSKDKCKCGPRAEND